MPTGLKINFVLFEFPLCSTVKKNRIDEKQIFETERKLQAALPIPRGRHYKGKNCFRFVADTPRQLLNSEAVSFPHYHYRDHIRIFCTLKRDIYRLRQKENTIFQVSNYTAIRRSVQEKFCMCELSYRPLYQTKLGLSKRELKFRWCVSGYFYDIV